MNNGSLPVSDIIIRKPIALIGMMGVGKTHIGRLLARHLGLSFFDSDDEIVASAGQSIPDIFEYYGEDAFRDLEAKVIKRLVSGSVCVLSTGGGAVTRQETLENLKLQTHLIWLHSDLDTLVERTARRDDRPLLKADDPKSVLRNLLGEREKFYKEAHYKVDTTESSSAVISGIVDFIANES